MDEATEAWNDGLDELLQEVEAALDSATTWHWSYGSGREGLCVSAMEHVDGPSDYVRIARLDEGPGWADEQGCNVILIGSAPLWLRILCGRLRGALAERKGLQERARKSVARKRAIRYLNRRVRDLSSSSEDRLRGLLRETRRPLMESGQQPLWRRIERELDPDGAKPPKPGAAAVAHAFKVLDGASLDRRQRDKLRGILDES